MNSVRTRYFWTTDDLPESEDEMVAIRARFSRTIEDLIMSDCSHNDENSPTEALVGGDGRLADRAPIRPSPRLPLKDVTYLFPSNVLHSFDKIEIVQRAMGRRRPLDAPLVSKRRAVQGNWYLGSRPSAVLRSFR